MYLVIAAGVAVVLAGAALLALVCRVLKAAHTRPGAADRGAPATGSAHAPSGWEHAVLSALTAIIRTALRLGVRMGPMMMLTVRGRATGQARTNPVDLFERDGRYWLVATHDANANWVRNLRAAGEGALTLGRRRYTFTAVELPQDQAGVVLEDVLGPRLARPVAGFVLRRTFAVPPGATIGHFVRAAALHPVFELAVDRAPARAAHPLAKPPAILIAVGALIALVHLTLGVGGIMTTTQWISGVAVGLLVSGLGNHLRIFGRS